MKPGAARGWLRLLLTLVIGAAGGGAFAAFDLPAAWLSGSMLAVGAAALAGLDAPVPPRFRDAVYTLLGVSMGGGVTPEVVHQMPTWPASLLALVITVAAVTGGSYWYLRRVAGWDRATAYFGSIPGALSMTLVTAEASDADLRRVSLSQTMRLFMLVAVLPLVVASIETLPAGSPAGGRVEDPLQLAIVLVAGTIGAAAGYLLRIPAGVLLGSFLVSSVLHAVGVVEGLLPLSMQVPAFVALGCFLGLRFAGTGWRLVVQTLVAGIGAFLVALAIASLGAFATAVLVGVPVGQVLVAFAPGGLEAMVILAFVLHADPAFVAAHHLARFLGMTLAVPMAARFVIGPDWAAKRGKRVPVATEAPPVPPA